MTIQGTRFCLAALLLGSSYSLTDTSSAQSLALAYDLSIGLRSPSPEFHGSDYCDSKYDASRLLQCGGAIAENLRWMDRSTLDVASGADARPHAEAPNVNVARTAPESRLRFSEDSGNGESTADEVPVRLGLKYRVRRNPGSSEPYGLTDPRFESWVQRKELNLVGVEILFRFH